MTLKARIVRLSRVGSTNDEAARLAAEGAEHGTVVVADEQSGGRGREGRRWHSPPGQNLYLSCVLRPDLELAAVPPITLAAGIAVCDVVNSAGAPASLKWPNDVLVSGRKIAGLLTEMQSRGQTLDHVILGVGLNVNADPDRFPPELVERVTSLRRELKARLDRERVLRELLSQLDLWLGRFFAGGVAAIKDDWMQRCDRSAVLGARIGGERVTGRPVGLGETGELLLEDDAGVTHRVVAGDLDSLSDEPGVLT